MTHPLLRASLAISLQLMSQTVIASDPDDGPSLRATPGNLVSPTAIAAVNAVRESDRVSASQNDCVTMTMNCDETVMSVLDSTDCALESGTFIDFWEFEGANGQRVTANLTSSQFDTYLLLLDPSSEVVAEDDDSGTGTNSSVVLTLGESGVWTLGVNGFSPDDLGEYSLQLLCAGSGLETPAAPSDLAAAGISTTEIDLDWQDNSPNEDEFRVEMRSVGGGFEDIGSVPAGSVGTIVSNLAPATTYDFRVLARNAEGASPYTNIASATTFAQNCPELRLLDSNRFTVSVLWRDFEGGSGCGRIVPFSSDDSGLFWFFAPDNWEMLVKMVDACLDPFNHFWFFAAATTNVEYTITVTDAQTQEVRQYFNPLGIAAAAVADTTAFDTCP